MTAPTKSTYPGFYWDRIDECFRRADTDARIEGNAPTRDRWDQDEAKRLARIAAKQTNRVAETRS